MSQTAETTLIHGGLSRAAHYSAHVGTAQKRQQLQNRAALIQKECMVNIKIITVGWIFSANVFPFFFIVVLFFFESVRISTEELIKCVSL